MKKFIISIALSITILCYLTAKPKQIAIPDTNENSSNVLIAHEKAKDYYFKFTAVNYGDAECEVTIYDKMYMRTYQPETKTFHFYYYKFIGDYEEGLPQRSGIFGYAVDLFTGEVYEIVFRNMFHGAYKFKSIVDHKKNDRRYASGTITWNEFPERKIPEPLYFLDFFERKDKKLNSNADEYGHKKDLAVKIYWSKSIIDGAYGYFEKDQ